MNSLQELNNFSQTTINYQDNRETIVTFNPTVPVHQAIAVNELYSFQLPVGTNITEIISLPQAITYSVIISTAMNANVFFGTLPGDTTSNVVVSSGLGITTTTISGITSIAEWDGVKSPTITANTSENFTITSLVTYNNGLTKTWTTSVTVVGLNELSPVSDVFYSVAALSYFAGPTIIPVVGQPTTENYTMTVTPNTILAVGNISTTGIGTSTFDNTTKVLTITGNVAKLNSHLSNITYWANDVNTSWAATYVLYNPATYHTSNKIQQFKNQTANYLTRSSPAYYYKNASTLIASTTTPHLVAGYPGTISNLDGVLRGEFQGGKLEIYPLQANLVATISSTANNNNGVFAFDNTSKRLTINLQPGLAPFTNVVENLYIQSVANVVDPILLVYKYTAPRNPTTEAQWYADGGSYIGYNPKGSVITRVQTLYVNTTQGFITNMNNSRTFQKNTPGLLFPTLVPVLTETLSGTYSIYLTSTAGEFGTVDNTTSSTYSHSGTYAQINGALSLMKFYPYSDVTGTQSFTYSQHYNGAVEISTQTVGLIGTGSNVLPTSESLSTLTSSGTWAPTFQQKYYYPLVDIAVISAGGGGAGYSTFSAGGGGGGAVRLVSNIALRSTANLNYGNSLSITVGTGGTGGAVSTGGSGGNSVFGNITVTGGSGGTDDYAANPLNGGYSGNGFGGGWGAGGVTGYGNSARAGGGSGGPTPDGKSGGPGTVIPWLNTTKYGAGGGGWTPTVGYPGGADGGGAGGIQQTNGQYNPGTSGSQYGAGGGGGGRRTSTSPNGGGGAGANGAIILRFHN